MKKEAKMGESFRMSKRMKMDNMGGDDQLVMKKIKGTVALTKKKGMVELNSIKAATCDLFDELIGRKVYLQLISAVTPDPAAASCGGAKEVRGKLGKPAHLENWCRKNLTFNVTFDWDEEFGLPGAFTIRNLHHNEFYLKTLTLEDVPNHGRVHFICNSWVYHCEHYKNDRVFFTNQTFLPNQTPELLSYYREEELKVLRGNDTGKLEEWDRVYDYDVYNDLGDPDNAALVRPTLGGSTDHPYPRRGRTGRPPTVKDPTIESRLPLIDSLKIYVPRDERFSDVKMADVVAYGLKLIAQSLLPGFGALFDKLSDKFVTAVEHILKHKFESISDKKFDEFQSFDEVLKLFECGIKLPSGSLLESIREKLPLEMLKELFRSDGEAPLKFPVPHVMKEDTSAWRTDEEFAREMLAGLNPVVIRRLQKFPPTSKLDPRKYGNQNSTITEEHLKDNLDGLDVNQAIENNRLYILDHHDPLMPYLRGINQNSTKTYATRTILFLQRDGTLKPLAIELSLPHEECDQGGAISTVYTPAEHGAEGTIWQLAKAYVAVNDSGYHQLVCHWLHTHASIEPFIIATNRQLSVLHPIHKLLHPHFRDTMNINAVARQTLINAGGLLEKTVFPDKYAMEMSSTMYKEWVFPDEALPKDLIKRGVAVEDTNAPHGVQLLIEDYPYAADGLEIWSTIKTWVKDYCSFYYETDHTVQKDCELQSWWEEVRTKGHGDKKNEPWWPKMQTREELIESCTTIIWIASALHAAVNFGQYPYGGYLLNRPAMSRRFIPKPGTEDYRELETDPEKAFLKTVTPQLQSILGISLIEILSRHSADEVFLGQRDTPEWTTDEEALKAFKNFGNNLAEVEKKLTELNKDEKLKNRAGPAKMPYTLLYPSSEVGLTFRGIPNSVTI